MYRHHRPELKFDGYASLRLIKSRAPKCDASDWAASDSWPCFTLVTSIQILCSRQSYEIKWQRLQLPREMMCGKERLLSDFFLTLSNGLYGVLPFLLHIFEDIFWQCPFIFIISYSYSNSRCAKMKLSSEGFTAVLFFPLSSWNASLMVKRKIEWSFLTWLFNTTVKASAAAWLQKEKKCL